MNVFDLDQALVNDYERFARSFTLIRAPDIQQQVEELYANDRFWPEPLVSINPRFEGGDAIDRLVANGTLHSAIGNIFSIDGKPLPLYRHQSQAVAKAVTGQSFVLTTGTGSGKSLCFFIPIIDAAVRTRATGEAPRTRAIVIYPMNALANSQCEEIDKFIKQSGLPDHLRPTFARYTGQESEEERERIREAKPDILLTNFMMLELLMTRQNGLDRAVSPMPTASSTWCSTNFTPTAAVKAPTSPCWCAASATASARKKRPSASVHLPPWRPRTTMPSALQSSQPSHLACSAHRFRAM